MDQKSDKDPILEQDDPPPPYDGARLPSLEPSTHTLGSTPMFDSRPVGKIDTWMTKPSVLNCPPGLGYLTEIDKLLFIKDQDRKAKTIKHHIKSDSGENVYTAIEEYELCCLICCNITRPFEVKILDQQEREVLQIHRPLRSQSCCFPCCLQSVTITASGTLCGFIKQSWHPLTPKFRICDATGKTILIIKGPSYVFKPIQYLGPDFKVYLNDGKTEVGNVSQYLTYMNPESFPDSAHFSVSFPMDLDVNLKAVLLATSILIESLYYAMTTRTAVHASESADIGFEVGHCLAHCLH